MRWKEMAVNDYPNIILSDSIVNNIQFDNGNIILNFIESGIIIKSSNDSKYYRTKAAQIILEKCDINNISIKYIHKKRWKMNMETDIVKEINWDIFMKNIQKKKWQYEIVEEFYSDIGGIFIGKVWKQKKSFWCILKIYFCNITYFWNEVDFSNCVN